MNRILIFLIVLVTFLSCASDDNGIESNLPGEIDLSFTEEAQITIVENPDIEASFLDIVDGDQLVFEFRREDGMDNEIADDEILELIVFEVDPDAIIFSYTEQDFIDNNVYYSVSCFCSTIGALPLETGTISGTKLTDNRWDITIDVIINVDGFPRSIIVSGIYNLVNN